MPEPYVVNPEPPGKPWYLSKTIWGLGLTFVSIALPKYQPIAEALPPIIEHVGVGVGLILGLIGRIKAKEPIR